MFYGRTTSTTRPIRRGRTPVAVKDLAQFADIERHLLAVIQLEDRPRARDLHQGFESPTGYLVRPTIAVSIVGGDTRVCNTVQ
jgi:hypothetical protein